jgi:hypothetical protein
MLDDDDELLPGALRARAAALLRDSSVDAVISNGYVIEPNGREDLTLDAIDSIRLDPLGQLMTGNWLATASGLFRSTSITEDYFDTTLKSNDMTYLAFRLALEKKIAFLDAPTYRKRYSPDSISLTAAWNLPATDTLEKMLRFEMPALVRRRIRRKLGQLQHDLSSYHLAQGDLWSSWHYHLRSLTQPSGILRYGLFTRKVIAAAVTHPLRGWRRSQESLSNHNSRRA